MTFIACGINHKTTELALREQVAFSAENTSHTLKQLMQSGIVNEALILSTCNRTDIYSHSQQPAQLMHWLREHPYLEKVINTPHWYCHQGQQAVSHVMRVASGVDSMVIGESQILAQLKDAMNLARQAGAVGGYLHRLLQRVFAVTKQVRNASGIGAAPISLAYVAVNLAKRIFANLANSRVLLVGSGQTIELVALHLRQQGVKRLVIANRSLKNAEKLAQLFQGHAISLEEIPLYLQQSDILVSATGSYSPLINKLTVIQALKATRKRRPLLMIDLGLPRDIEPEVADLEDVYLYNVDQLGTIIKENLNSRHQAAEQASALIETHAAFFMHQLQALNAVDTICAYRDKIQQFSARELAAAQAKLTQGKDPAQVLAEMTDLLINKIMHQPSVQLQQAAFDGDKALLIAARRLFDL